MTLSKKEIEVRNCNMCIASDLVEKTGKWFKLFNQRSEGTAYAVTGLDFCSITCVQNFVNEELKVSFVDNSPMLGASDSNFIGMLAFLGA